MRRPTIVPFADEHVAGAACVLARRHAAHRAASPFLPDCADYEAQVRAAAESATGAVALAGDEVVGYLLGPRATDAIGPHVWSHVAGHAVDDPDVVRDLYTVAAQRWVDEGLRRHFVFAPALDTLVQPWFRLGFGASLALAVRRTSGIPQWSAPGVTVRRSTAADTRAIALLERELYRHLQRSPSFSGLTLEPEESFVQEWQGFEVDDRFVSFVGEVDGDVVGQLLLYRRPVGDLRVPPNSIDLGSATTAPELRGRGVGTALTWTAVAWAREQGMDTVTTDWRMTNLLAARFWPSCGFRETHLRLYRSIP
jgi:ribosomal protein S18 acetylase RimI-like enzyme